METINSVAQVIGNFGMNLLFFNILFFVDGQKVEFLTAFIVFSSVLLMVWLKFPNIRFFVSSLKMLVCRGYEKVQLKNAINSQKAFWSSIAGCVGVGNITGMCAAVYFGGPGTVFWIMLCGFITMPLRYVEVFFGHKLRTEKNGFITECGPFSYVHYAMNLVGLKSLNWLKIFAFLFIFAGIGAISIQVNPMVGVIAGESNQLLKYITTAILCVIIFYVITGGLRRISAVASKLGVYMSVLYVVAVSVVIIVNKSNLLNAILLILHEAFNIKSIYGGILTVIFLSFRRAIVSTEVGFGTTSLLHGRSDRASSKDEAKLAMVAPFFGNLVFCSLNGLMLVASGAFTHGNGDIETMRFAFVQFHPLMNYVLIVIILLFGFSTIITWFYYANSALKRITDKRIIIKSLPFIYCVLMFISALTTFSTLLLIIDFTTLLITIPNIIALIYLTYRFKKKGEIS
jgi:AGCS family alanine or glycine:cation symporter